MVYYVANKLLFSEYSFLERAVVNKRASILSFNSNCNNITNTDIQHLTLHTHIKLLSIIVEIHLNIF